MLKLFEKNNYHLAQFEHIEAGEELLDSFDIERLSLETVMFQAGYLTIKAVQQWGSSLIYTLTFPNLEVRNSFNNYLLNYYFVRLYKKTKVQLALYKQLAAAKLDELEATFKAL